MSSVEDQVSLTSKNKVVPELIFEFFFTIQKIFASSFEWCKKVRKNIRQSTMARLFVDDKQNGMEEV